MKTLMNENHQKIINDAFPQILSGQVLFTIPIRKVRKNRESLHQIIQME